MTVIKRSTPEEIASRIKDLGVKGFGGQCIAAAIKINENVFNGKGKYVGVVNKFWWDHGKHFIGHVAVLYDGIYWDADAIPKDESDIEEWGMLDPEDPEYNHHEKWLEKDAYIVEMWYFTKRELLVIAHK